MLEFVEQLGSLSAVFVGIADLLFFTDACVVFADPLKLASYPV